MKEWLDDLSLSGVFEYLKELLNKTLFSLGETDISLVSILTFILSSILVVYLSGLIKRALTNRLLKRYNVELSWRQTIGTLTRYFLLFIGFLIILDTSGIDLSSLKIIFGALGVGIGFGLQNITNNLISGIIILFERPIKVGDRIQVGEIDGDVTSISARSTTILTNDNISIIVPNSEFISSRVINWSHNDRRIRFKIPVGVSYNEDPEKIRNLLEALLMRTDGILKNPAPRVIFKSYGDSSLDFELYVWSSEYMNRPAILRSELLYEVFKQFKKEGVEIPFPQRDLHLKSGFGELIDKNS